MAKEDMSDEMAWPEKANFSWLGHFY